MIVKLTRNEYIDFPGGNYAEHFVKRSHYYKVSDYKNGCQSVKLVNCAGSMLWACLNDCKVVKE